ncbi:MAG: hypothetical protein ACI82F_003671, partial [Planctomycetota bacterium]
VRDVVLGTVPPTVTIALDLTQNDTSELVGRF